MPTRRCRPFHDCLHRLPAACVVGERDAAEAASVDRDVGRNIPGKILQRIERKPCSRQFDEGDAGIRCVGGVPRTAS